MVAVEKGVRVEWSRVGCWGHKCWLVLGRGLLLLGEEEKTGKKAERWEKRREENRQTSY